MADTARTFKKKHKRIKVDWGRVIVELSLADQTNAKRMHDEHTLLGNRWNELPLSKSLGVGSPMRTSAEPPAKKRARN